VGDWLPFNALCAAWVLGIPAGRTLPLDASRWLILAGMALLALIVLRGRRRWRIVFACALLLAAGAARLQLELPADDASHVSFYNDLRAQVRLTGVVVSDPEQREGYTRLVVRAERIQIAALELAEPVDGLVLVYASRLTPWAYGDWVRVRGELATPPSETDFDYARVLANEGVYSWMPAGWVDLLEHGHGSPLLAAIYALRSRLLQVLLGEFPDPEAPLLAGILLGVESGISPATRGAFDRTGTTHIIAISGFNLTLLAQASIRICGRTLGRRRGVVAAIAVIALYTVMVGADPPVVRAAIMAALGLLARYLGRVSQALRSLVLAGLLMTVINPLTLYEVGFQLSFAATLGLILYADPLQAGAQRVLGLWLDDRAADRISPFVGEYALFTLAAQLTTLPITASAFHRLSLVSIFANILVLPLQPGLMLLGGLAMLLGAVLRPLGQAAAWVAWPFPALTIRLVELCAGLPASSLRLNPLAPGFAPAYYLILLGGTAGMRWIGPRAGELMQALRRRIKLRLAALPLLAAFFILVLLMWHAFLTLPDGRLRLTLLDVEDGEAILLQAPGGGRVLINGGSSSLRLGQQLSPHFPLFNRTLDWLIVSGDEYDQLAGLLGLGDRFPPARILAPGTLDSSTARRLLEEWNTAGIPLHPLEQGMRLRLGGANLQVAQLFDSELALVLEYGALRVLLLPGASPGLLAALLEEIELDGWDAIVLPSCGDPRLVPPELLADLQSVLLLACEPGEGSGWQAEETSRSLRTDLSGDIELTSDGLQLWVTTGRR